jgi:hypothetical protein
MSDHAFPLQFHSDVGVGGLTLLLGLFAVHEQWILLQVAQKESWDSESGFRRSILYSSFEDFAVLLSVHCL